MRAVQSRRLRPRPLVLCAADGWTGSKRSASRYGSGTAQIDRFANVQVLALARYFAVKTVFTGLSPVTTNDALACCSELPASISARASAAGRTVAPAPLVAND